MSKPSAFASVRGMFGRASALCVVAGLLVGCPDPEAQQRQEVAAQFEKALAIYRQAEQGYAAEGVSPDEARHAKLQEAATILESVRSRGSDAQKVASLRLLADIYEYTARYEQAQAMANWAKLSTRDTVLMGYFNVLSDARSRAEAIRRDATDLLNKLQADQRAIDQEIATLRKQTSDLSVKIAGLNKQIEQLASQRDALTAEAMKLRQDAFVAEGDAKFELNEQSALKQREADSLDGQIQELQVEVNRHTAEANLATQALELRQARLQAVANQIQQVNARQTEATRALAAMHSEIANAEQQVLSEIQAMTGTYAEQVAALFDSAVEKATRAAETVGQAAAFARGDNHRSEAIRIEQARKQVTLLGILADRAVVQAKFGRTLAVIDAHAARVMPDHAQTIAGVFKQVQDQATQVAQAAQQAAEAGLEALGNINTEDVQNELRTLLTTYQTRVQEVKVEPLTVSRGAPRPSGVEVATLYSPALDVTSAATAQTTAAPALPALPDALFGEQIVAFVVIDHALLTPDALEQTVKAVAGEQAMQLLGEPLAEYRTRYKAMENVGGQGMIVAIPTPNEDGAEAKPIVFVGGSQAVDAEKVQEALREMAGGADVPVTFAKVGQWMAVLPEGVKMPAAADAKRKAFVEQAVKAAGSNAITVVSAPSAQARELAFAMAAQGEEQGEIQQIITKSMQWLAVGITLGNQPKIDVTMKMANNGDAQKLKGLIDETLKPAQPQPGDMMAMMLAQAVQAFTINQDGDAVKVNIDGVKLRPLVQNMVMMFAMMQQQQGGIPGAFE